MIPSAQLAAALLAAATASTLPRPIAYIGTDPDAVASVVNPLGRVVALVSSQLPERWYGFEPYRLVVLHGPPRVRLTRERARALTRWIQSGGSLLVCPAGDRPGPGAELAGRLPSPNTERLSFRGSPLPYSGDKVRFRFGRNQPRIILFTSRPQPGGLHVEDEQGNLIYWRRGMGRGWLHHLAFDPGSGPFRGWGTQLWRSHVLGTGPKRTGEPALDSGQVALLDLSRHRLPSPAAMALLPVSYLLALLLVIAVCRRTRTVGLVAPAIAALSLGYSIVIVVTASSSSRDDRPPYREVAISHGVEGSLDLFSSRWLSLFSWRARSIEVILPASACVQVLRPGAPPASFETDVHGDGPLAFEVPVRSRGIVLVATRDFQSVRTIDRIKIAARRDQFVVTNGSRLTLRSPVLHLGTPAVLVLMEDIGPGQSRSVHAVDPDSPFSHQTLADHLASGMAADAGSYRFVVAAVRDFLAPTIGRSDRPELIARIDPDQVLGAALTGSERAVGEKRVHFLVLVKK